MLPWWVTYAARGGRKHGFGSSIFPRQFLAQIQGLPAIFSVHAYQISHTVALWGCYISMLASNLVLLFFPISKRLFYLYRKFPCFFCKLFLYFPLTGISAMLCGNQSLHKILSVRCSPSARGNWRIRNTTVYATSWVRQRQSKATQSVKLGLTCRADES